MSLHMELLCIVNGQIAATLSHRHVQSAIRNALLILNYSVLQHQCGSFHSRNPIFGLANTRTNGAASFFFSFLFFSVYMPWVIAGCYIKSAYVGTTSKNYTVRYKSSWNYLWLMISPIRHLYHFNLIAVKVINFITL